MTSTIIKAVDLFFLHTRPTKELVDRLHNLIGVRNGHMLSDRQAEQLRVAAIDKEILAGLAERGIGLKFRKGDRIMDTGLNSARQEVRCERIAPFRAYDEQMIDL